MADPMGLADLGLRGLGKVFKHGSSIRERHRDLKTLGVALEKAHDALITAKSSADLSVAHEEILEPLINETILFFETVDSRKRVKSFAANYVQPGRDSVDARRLLEALKAAPEQIQAKTQIRQVLLTQAHLQELPQVLKNMCEKQHRDFSQMTGVILLCNLFFDKGARNAP
ncbi:hypothetical protein EXIGLDRAFT_832720 [Exidia glandulosa HHB12029]|uniref:BAR domain-containing protein n=1 Tax=Exidia glandulosa HHB12029 TaxID=1314781 RepID=A0A165LD85_EXIGL|nr:hypothetical protein EXIGLDRAFT_832720 [Exidia glandulosa HHB12029]